MKTRTVEPTKMRFCDLDLINNLDLSLDKADLTQKTHNIVGLGEVTKYEYAYLDICSNAMK